jgi:hypothetical protein
MVREVLMNNIQIVRVFAFRQTRGQFFMNSGRVQGNHSKICIKVLCIKAWKQKAILLYIIQRCNLDLTKVSGNPNFNDEKYLTKSFIFLQEYCCQSVLLYFDNQWKRVYPGGMMV